MFLHRKLRRGLSVALAVLALALGTASVAQNRLLATAWDPEVIDAAIAKEAPHAAAVASVTGITVPHHLLAADLIARGVLAAKGARVDRILLIAPDHFRRLKTPFGVTTTGIETVFGPLPMAGDLAKSLLSDPAFSATGDGGDEHSIHAVTPFIARLFPGVELTAITTARGSTRTDWDHAVSRIAPLLTPGTLVVQSTDYSHFLPVSQAILRDQETLAAIASGDPEAMLALAQPAHFDSMAAQYIQMALQAGQGAAPVILGNRNAHFYTSFADPGPTTSYIVTAFTTDPGEATRFDYPDQSVTLIGGDTYLGRGWWDRLTSPNGAANIAAQVRALTHDRPLILNLEGVLLPDRPAGANRAQHFMRADLALPVLTQLNLAGAVLANNHAQDFGADGAAISLSLLSEAGITALDHGEIADIGPFRVLPLTFKRGYFRDHPVVRSTEDLGAFCTLPATPPLVAVVHWGGDYVNMASPFEAEVLDALARCGVSAVVGSHSHLASTTITAHAGGALQAVFSTGNLLFDQTGPVVSGALAEIRVLETGNVALRLIPIPNLYETR